MKLGVKFLIAGAVFCGIAALSLAYAVGSLTSAVPATEEFRVPGSFTKTTSDAARYYVWDCHETLFEGAVVKRDQALPDGYKVTVTNAAGDELPFDFDRKQSFSVGSHKMTSVGSVQAPADTELTVSIDGFEEPFRVASFEKSSFRDIVMKSVLPFFLSVGMGLVGGLALLIGFVLVITDTKRKASTDAQRGFVK